MNPVSETYNEDNMIGMSRYPDKYFELAIVDPPYGIGFDGEVQSMVTNKGGFNWKGARGNGYKRKEWDSQKPSPEYFQELFRVSEKQIIFGGNYFELPISGGWVVWDKRRPETFSLSQAELAWVSFTNRVAMYSYRWSGMLQEKAGDLKEVRQHPTQKPVALYKWLLKNYAKPGDKILDTHLGSGSSRIAAYDMGFDFYGWEIDADYFKAGEQRFSLFKSQTKLDFVNS